ncbi:MAG: hypothetical protein B6I19_01675 [Bacteroidetes bacterium 4572_114]|nr:MAG: hypothetical protein B6I19_01675 [Bacteroidetes bacterium 4572_114]
MDPNKIDDIFREGLEGYSEQASKGLWKKISGSLLRYELSRFNLTNVPRHWIGVAAAGIIAVSLFVYNFNTSAPDIVTNITATEKDNPVIVPNQPNQSIYAPVDKEGQSILDDNISTPSVNQNQALILPKTREEIITDNLSPINYTKVETGTGKNIHVPEEETSLDLAENEIGQPDAVKQKGDQSTLAAATVLSATAASSMKPAGNTNQEINTNANALEDQASRNSTNEIAEEVGISQLDSRHAEISTRETNGGMNEIQTFGQPDPTLTHLNLAGHESGKIQKMHSLSYSFGQFFKSKYKPPKRRFSENSSTMMRGNNPYLSIAAYFAPELTQYSRMESTSREQSYIGGLSLTYNTSKFLVEGGVELSYSYDLGDYVVDMQTYDSIGFYNSVNGFIQDPNNPDSVIFDTQMVPVHDSVQHNLHQQTQNQYTYLQFPLMVGYQAMESGIFSAYIKAGPSFSFLLNRQEPNLSYINPDATVNQINNYTPTRMNTSIQVLVSVSLKLQLNEKFGILVEPTYRYYLKSVYDNNNASLKNPYGIGVRGGLYFDL